MRRHSKRKLSVTSQTVCKGIEIQTKVKGSNSNPGPREAIQPTSPTRPLKTLEKRSLNNHPRPHSLIRAFIHQDHTAGNAVFAIAVKK